MLTRHIALVPEVGMNASELARVSAALQKQVTRDLAPVWGISATVDAFPCLEDLPAGYWPVVLTFRELGIDAGIHIDDKGQPYALVEMSPSWSLTASHICLEMLSDPFGNRMLAGASPRPDQGQVEYLTDICDPCGHPQYAYVVNDVLVSDFCTPSFWEPASRRERYSFTGAVQAPLEILPGGHLRWYDPATDSWWTRRILGGGPSDVNIGRAESRRANPREFLDAHTPHHLALTRMTADAFEARMAQSQQQSLVAARSRAYLLRTTLGTARPSRSDGNSWELEGAARGERQRSDRHPQVLGALLRASIVAGGSRENPRYEETMIADDVEEVTVVDDMGASQVVAAPPPVAAEPEAQAPRRTVPPPLPQTLPPPAEPSIAVAGPSQAPTPTSEPPRTTIMPPSMAPVARDPRASAPAARNMTLAIAAAAAAVVLGLALRDRVTSDSSGVAASPRAPEPAAAPIEKRAAPSQLAATPPQPPAATPQASPQAVAAPAPQPAPQTVATPAPPPAQQATAAPQPVAMPAVAALRGVASPQIAPAPPASVAQPSAALPSGETASEAARRAPPRPKPPVAAAPPVARAPRSSERQGQDSLDSLIDDRR